MECEDVVGFQPLRLLWPPKPNKDIRVSSFPALLKKTEAVDHDQLGKHPLAAKTPVFLFVFRLLII